MEVDGVEPKLLGDAGVSHSDVLQDLAARPHMKHDSRNVVDRDGAREIELLADDGSPVGKCDRTGSASMEVREVVAARFGWGGQDAVARLPATWRGGAHPTRLRDSSQIKLASVADFDLEAVAPEREPIDAREESLHYEITAQLDVANDLGRGAGGDQSRTEHT